MLLTQILKTLKFKYKLSKYSQTKADKSMEW